MEIALRMEGVFESFLGNILFTLVTLIIAIIIFVFNRKKFFKFFGISKDKKDVIIYLSAVEVIGSSNKYEHKANDYIGTLIGFTEMKGAVLVHNKLRSNFFLFFPKKWFSLLGNMNIALSIIDPIIEPSPRKDSDISNSHIIALGSSNFNWVTNQFFLRNELFFEFWFDEKGVPYIVKNKDFDGKRKARTDIKELAFIQKFRDNNRNVIICAGASQGTTFGSIRHLVDNWRALYKKFGEKDFGVLIEFSSNRDLNSIPLDKGRIIDDETVHKKRHFPISQSFVDNNEFFSMSYSQTLQHYHVLQDEINKSSQELIQFSPSIDKDIIKVRLSTNQYKYFHFLKGEVGEVASPIITLDFTVFRYLLFIDFSRWRTPIDYFKGMVTKFPNLDEEQKVIIQNISHYWYFISSKAAFNFFYNQSNLNSYFSKFSHTWWDKKKTSQQKFQTLTEILYKNVDVSNKIILDAGCGFGRLSSIFLLGNSFLPTELIQVDISERLLGSSASIYDGIKCNVKQISKDINSIEFGDNYFDLIYLIQVSVHLSDPFATIKKLSKELSPNGMIWVDFTCTSFDKDKDNFFQESFFTRIYQERYVIERIKELGLNISDTKFRIADRHGNYWLLLCLMK